MSRWTALGFDAPPVTLTLLGARAEVGETVALSAEEARHSLKAMRAHVGDGLACADGRGRLYRATLLRATTSACDVRIDACVDVPPEPGTILCFAGLEAARADVLVEAATALGVTTFQPVIADRSDEWLVRGQPHPRASRWDALVRAATKQSLRAWMPTLARVDAWPTSATGLVIVADADRGLAPDAIAWDASELLHLCVGPPSGFSDTELATFERDGATFVALGPHRLRTEVAAIALMAHVSARRIPNKS